MSPSPGGAEGKGKGKGRGPLESCLGGILLFFRVLKSLKVLPFLLCCSYCMKTQRTERHLDGNLSPSNTLPQLIPLNTSNIYYASVKCRASGLGISDTKMCWVFSLEKKKLLLKN